MVGLIRELIVNLVYKFLHFINFVNFDWIQLLKSVRTCSVGNPCSNGATCSYTLSAGVKCLCTPGWSGQACNLKGILIAIKLNLNNIALYWINFFKFKLKHALKTYAKMVWVVLIYLVLESAVIVVGCILENIASKHEHAQMIIHVLMAQRAHTRLVLLELYVHVELVGVVQLVAKIVKIK